jgi:L-ascorbate metabolism protein UlaG (beta-lactamase superfamily)
MNPDDAVKAHLDLNAKCSIAMHFGTFKLTTEAIDQPAKDLSTSLKTRGVGAERFTVPVEGSTVIVEAATIPKL